MFYFQTNKKYDYLLICVPHLDKSNICIRLQTTRRRKKKKNSCVQKCLQERWQKKSHTQIITNADKNVTCDTVDACTYAFTAQITLVNVRNDSVLFPVDILNSCQFLISFRYDAISAPIWFEQRRKNTAKKTTVFPNVPQLIHHSFSNFKWHFSTKKKKTPKLDSMNSAMFKSQCQHQTLSILEWLSMQKWHTRIKILMTLFSHSTENPQMTNYRLHSKHTHTHSRKNPISQKKIGCVMVLIDSIRSIIDKRPCFWYFQETNSHTQNACLIRQIAFKPAGIKVPWI